MLQGFVGCFMIGFLATAAPRVLQAPPLQKSPLMLLFVLQVACSVAHVFGYHDPANLGFILALLILVFNIASRAIGKRKWLPPGIAMAVIGILTAVAALSYEAVAGSTTLSNRYFHQAFLLLPILGIGSYLFPLIFKTRKKQSAELKLFRKVEAVVVSVILLLTYWIENQGATTAMPATRALICLVWLTEKTKWYRQVPQQGPLAWGVKSAILALITTQIMLCFVPYQRIAIEHLTYISVFGLLCLTVGSRVSISHSGDNQQLSKWSASAIMILSFIWISALTRVTADFMPAIRVSHHIYAAVFWVIGVTIWWRASKRYWKLRPIKKATLDIPSF